MSWKNKRMQLRELADRTEDQRLKSEILSYLKEEQEELEAFQKPEPGMEMCIRDRLLFWIESYPEKWTE